MSAGLLVTTLVVVASVPGATATGRTARKLSATTLEVSGATLPAAFYVRAINGFRAEQPEVTINYFARGSATGRRELAAQAVDLAGSDTPPGTGEAGRSSGADLVAIPTVVAPIAVAYNLGPAAPLRLSATTISRIFQRQVLMWNDAAIAAENRGVLLPAVPIRVVRRADESGTTAGFVDFLGRQDPVGWKLGRGESPAWPADTEAAVGSVGVATRIRSLHGAVGYVGFSDARAAGLQLVAVRNQTGRYVVPSVEGASAAVDGMGFDAGGQGLVSAGAPSADSYPITVVTWLIARRSQPDISKAEALRAFLLFVETNGQELAPAVGFAPLPEKVRKAARAAIKLVVATP